MRPLDWIGLEQLPRTCNGSLLAGRNQVRQPLLRAGVGDGLVHSGGQVVRPTRQVRREVLLPPVDAKSASPDEQGQPTRWELRQALYERSDPLPRSGARLERAASRT